MPSLRFSKVGIFFDLFFDGVIARSRHMIVTASIRVFVNLATALCTSATDCCTLQQMSRQSSCTSERKKTEAQRLRQVASNGSLSSPEQSNCHVDASSSSGFPLFYHYRLWVISQYNQAQALIGSKRCNGDLKLIAQALWQLPSWLMNIDCKFICAACKSVDWTLAWVATRQTTA